MPSLKYYHQDHLGGTNILADDLGVSKELIEYTPFGSLARHDMYGTSEEVAHFYFTGKELDDEVGLYYYGARYYDPSLGRFITADILVQDAFENPQTLNRYFYTGNNPVNYVDPTGNGFFSALFNLVVALFINYAIDSTIVEAAQGDISVGQAASQILTTVASASTLGASGVQYGKGTFLLRAASAVQISSQAADNLGYEKLANKLGNVSQVAGSAYLGINVSVGIKDWIHENRFAIRNVEGKEVRVKNGNAVGIPGAGGNPKTVTGLGANVIADNPSSGLIADFTEAFLQKITFTSSVDRQLANAIRGLQNITLIGHSQGAIIASNTLLNLGLTGSRSTVTNARFFANPLSFVRTYLTATAAGVNIDSVEPVTNIIDPINVVQPNSNSISLFGGIIGVLTGEGIKSHKMYSY